MDSQFSLSNNPAISQRYSNLPPDLIAVSHWFVCGKPLVQKTDTTKAALTLDGKIRAKWRKDLNSHSSFETALAALASLNFIHGTRIQFLEYILWDDDPWTCIDFDPIYQGKMKTVTTAGELGNRIKTKVPYEPHEYTTQVELDYINWLVNNHHTYIELSTNGKGVHIWIRGDIEPDERERRKKTDKIEIYSRLRQIVCTGHSISAINYQIDSEGVLTLNETRTDDVLPIMDGQELIEQLVVHFNLEKGHSKPHSNPSEPPSHHLSVVDTIALKNHEELDNRFLRSIFNNQISGHRTLNIFNNQYSPSDILGSDTSPSAARNSLLITLCTFTKDDNQVARCFMRSPLSDSEKIRSRDGFLQSEIQSARNYVERKNKNKYQSGFNNSKQINTTGRGAPFYFDAAAFDRGEDPFVKPENKYIQGIPETKRFIAKNASELSKYIHEDWVIKYVLPAIGFGAFFGPSGCGKSFLLLEAIGCISSGRNFFGFKTKPRSIAYIYFEGASGIPKRIRAYEDVNGPLTNVFFIKAVAADLMVDEQFNELIHVLHERIGIGGMVCIDTLAASAPALDENSSEGMGRMIQCCHNISETLSCLTLVVHHTGKDTTRGLRGHSSLGAALDASIEVYGKGKTKKWSSDKVKEEEDTGDKSFYLKPIRVGTDSDGDPIRSCVIDQIHENKANAKEMELQIKSTVEEWIIDAIENGTKTGVKVLESIRKDTDAKFTQLEMRKARKMLIKDKVFIYEGKGGNAKLVFGPNYDTENKIDTNTSVSSDNGIQPNPKTTKSNNVPKTPKISATKKKSKLELKPTSDPSVLIEDLDTDA